MILTPKNWHTFQHYNKRNPPWIKLHRALLDDYEFSMLPVESRALAPMLWLIASESKDGCIQMSSEALAFRLRTDSASIGLGLKPLITAGLFIDASDVLAGCLQHATPEAETETETEGREEKKPFQEDETLNGTTIHPAPARPIESQEQPNVDETWNVTDDEFGDEGYDSIPMGMDALDVALAAFDDADAKKLAEAGASVEDCKNIAELIRLSGGTLESVGREK